ncbi:PREDICTED: uncharacterized protein LOC105459162 isoform X2 [Wasmannia auropunctata]|uniref:uncharacterized protein LOC105459162 isoform X2 n=1 Tax=Wasmannia auropunctata TaxID=64793 RepID=UPI0005F0A9AB|nr:PREDICTED: uncharacterized protein LOC105459162 isoform X2 [Wasmannia auropunctata]
MRVHLLLILLFASTALARSARNTRHTDVTTLPRVSSTTQASNGKTTTDITEDDDGIKCLNKLFPTVFSQPIKTISNLVQSSIYDFNNVLSIFLKALNLSGYMLRATIYNWMLNPLRIVIGALKHLKDLKHIFRIPVLVVS